MTKRTRQEIEDEILLAYAAGLQAAAAKQAKR